VIGADGRVNAAHQRKQKRLNEDLEELLSNIEASRAEEATADARLRELVSIATIQHMCTAMLCSVCCHIV
jgi:hypothetical protein